MRKLCRGVLCFLLIVQTAVNSPAWDCCFFYHFFLWKCICHYNILSVQMFLHQVSAHSFLFLFLCTSVCVTPPFQDCSKAPYTWKSFRKHSWIFRISQCWLYFFVWFILYAEARMGVDHRRNAMEAMIILKMKVAYD